jgi:hypothetical protein
MMEQQGIMVSVPVRTATGTGTEKICKGPQDQNDQKQTQTLWFQQCIQQPIDRKVIQNKTRQFKKERNKKV